MARPSKTLRALLDEFLCVRVTDMRGVDLARYAFDFDLTFAILTMDARGRVYHRYGGRDTRGADVWLSEASLKRTLRASLEQHAASEATPVRDPPAPLRIDEVPSFKKRDKGECIHCHQINTSLFEEARDGERLTPDWIWKHPAPERIGLDLDRDDQSRVLSVKPGSPVEHAGLKSGDRILSLGTTSVASASDVMFALDRASPGASELPLSFERDGTTHEAKLTLEEGWKRGTPREFAWRPTKWAMTPAPGFGGPKLSPEELGELGLDRGSFAFRVKYLVTWGDNKRYGKAAARAGLREGDIVTSVDGRSDFLSLGHFHAWWRLEQEPREVVKIEAFRKGKRKVFELTVIP